MREILFRGKSVQTGEWIDGSLIIDEKNNYYIGRAIMPKATAAFGVVPSRQNGKTLNRFIGIGFVMVIPETVGQFTGLFDNYSQRIYEGDIVKADDYIFSINFGKCGGTPNADAYGYMGFYLEGVSEGTKLCLRYGLRDDLCYFTDIAVLGNIHENTVLLTGGAGHG